VAVLAIVSLGASLAAFNLWYRHATTHRIHEKWGTEAMLRIAESPDAEWWELADADDAAASAASDRDRISVDGRIYSIRRRGDLNRARGFVHLRNSLGQDASYAWATDDLPTSPWRWAIVFLDDSQDADARTIVLIDENAARLAAMTLPPKEVAAVKLTAKMTAGLKTFLAEQGEAP
jgi:hypothetical protein